MFYVQKTLSFSTIPASYDKYGVKLYYFPDGYEEKIRKLIIEIKDKAAKREKRKSPMNSKIGFLISLPSIC